jgi:benzoate-CoA ligase
VPRYAARLLAHVRDAVLRGEIGSLWIRGDSICSGYWNQHEKTKSTIEGHWIRTGDKYTQDVDGFYWYAGRNDDMLKVGGLWVSPVEVENALVAHGAVLESGVVGREDHDGLLKPMAFVVLRDAGALARTCCELRQFVRRRLAEKASTMGRVHARSCPRRPLARSSASWASIAGGSGGQKVQPEAGETPQHSFAWSV